MGKKGGGGGLDVQSLANQQEEMNRVNVFSPYGTQMFGNSQVDDQGNIVFVPNTGDDQRAMQIIESPFQQSQRQDFENVSGNLSGKAVEYSRRLPSEAPTLSRVSSGPSLGMIGTGPSLQSDVSDLDSSGLIGLPGANDFGAERSRAEGAMYDRAAGRVMPQFDRDKDALVQSLADRGIPVGSDAYNQELQFFEQNKNNALNDLALGAVGAGGDEQSRMFGLALSGRGQQFGERSRLFDAGLQKGSFRNSALQGMFDNDVTRTSLNNSAQQQMFNNELTSANFNNNAGLTERATGFNELANLMGTTPSMPLPSFGGAAPVDVMGPAIANANANRGGSSGFLNVVGALGGAALGNPAAFGSSKDFKDQIGEVDPDDILEKVEALPVVEWRYHNGTRLGIDQSKHIGPYAEDFNALFGTGVDNGIDVDTSQIHVADATGVLIAAVKALSARVKQLEEGNDAAI